MCAGGVQNGVKRIKGRRAAWAEDDDKDDGIGTAAAGNHAGSYLCSTPKTSLAMISRECKEWQDRLTGGKQVYAVHIRKRLWSATNAASSACPRRRGGKRLPGGMAKSSLNPQPIEVTLADGWAAHKFDDIGKFLLELAKGKQGRQMMGVVAHFGGRAHGDG